MQIADVKPDTLIHGAEDAANKIAGTFETVGARTAKGAEAVADSASALGGRVGELGGQLADRLSQAEIAARRARLRSARPRVRGLRRPQANADKMLTGQLLKTSRELAHQSSDLNQAVDSLNSVIKANRKSAARGRTRLIAGALIGAVLMYHMDSEHGHERRQATMRRLRGVAGRD